MDLGHCFRSKGREDKKHWEKQDVALVFHWWLTADCWNRGQTLELMPTQVPVPVRGCWDVSCQHSFQPHERLRHMLIPPHFISTIGVWICALEPVIGASGKGVGELKSEGCYMIHTNRMRNFLGLRTRLTKDWLPSLSLPVVLPLELSKPCSSNKWRQ